MLHQLKNNISNKLLRYNYNKAKSAFEKAIPSRNYLPESEFDKFVQQYSNVAAGPRQDYSLAGMEALALERFQYIGNKINFKPSSVLEIGPGAGFVLKKFKENGINKAVALDIVDSLYPEVKKAGVEIVLSSADNMDCIPDKSYDLIVSWSALEHIPNPRTVFEECLRILKPGGYLYLQFGPLYYSPWGYHHYSVLKCPYLHLLFPEQLIHNHARNIKGEDYKGYLPWTNGCDLNEYQFLKRGLSYEYILESYNSGYDMFSASMISRYPDIFKSKNVPFESFFVDWIQVGILRKP
jgi:ubiquinone/menaquinone biosynthesis C-methylase UbiE